jgi:hypothetical protein
MMRRLVRWLSAATLALLAMLGLERFWLPVLLAGLLGSRYLGRWYCSWCCPVASAVACAGKRRKPASGRTPVRGPVSRALPIAWFGLLAAVFTACLFLGLVRGCSWD